MNTPTCDHCDDDLTDFVRAEGVLDDEHPRNAGQSAEPFLATMCPDCWARAQRDRSVIWSNVRRGTCYPGTRHGLRVSRAVFAARVSS